MPEFHTEDDEGPGLLSSPWALIGGGLLSVACWTALAFAAIAYFN